MAHSLQCSALAVLLHHLQRLRQHGLTGQASLFELDEEAKTNLIFEIFEVSVFFVIHLCCLQKRPNKNRQTPNTVAQVLKSSADASPSAERAQSSAAVVASSCFVTGFEWIHPSLDGKVRAKTNTE